MIAYGGDPITNNISTDSVEKYFLKDNLDYLIKIHVEIVRFPDKDHF